MALQLYEQFVTVTDSPDNIAFVTMRLEMPSASVNMPGYPGLRAQTCAHFYKTIVICLMRDFILARNANVRNQGWKLASYRLSCVFFLLPTAGNPF